MARMIPAALGATQTSIKPDRAPLFRLRRSSASSATSTTARLGSAALRRTVAPKPRERGTFRWCYVRRTSAPITSLRR